MLMCQDPHPISGTGVDLAERVTLNPLSYFVVLIGSIIFDEHQSIIAQHERIVWRFEHEGGSFYGHFTLHH